MSQAIGHRMTARLVSIGVGVALSAGALAASTAPAAATVPQVVPAAGTSSYAKPVVKSVKKHYAKAYKKLPKAPRISLTDANRGSVSTVPSAMQGATIPVMVGAAYANATVKVWLFSSPRLAYYGTVAADGNIQVVLPMNAKPGTHKLAVFTKGKALIGWAPLEVTARPITNLAAPSIVGKALTQYVVKAKAGSWSPKPVKLSYRWSVDGTPIERATKKTYKIKLSDLGKALTVTVTATRKGTAPVSVTSAPVTVTQKALTNVTAPTLVKKGSKVLAKHGSWSTKGLKFTYSWSVDGSFVKSTRSPVYKPRSGDAGKQLTVTVTAYKRGYQLVSVMSAPFTIQPKAK